MRRIIDLNCDMGEGMPTDEQLMPLISSANIACGYHAGDSETMVQTLRLCKKYGVAAGAHPGFDDKENFGRIPMQVSTEELYRLITDQLKIMQQHCEHTSVVLHHVKPHGALYNMAAADRTISSTLARAVADFNRNLIFYGLSGSAMVEEAEKLGLRTANEVFADRTYQPDGSLTPRSHSKALIASTETSLHQVMQMIDRKSVTTLSGEVIPLRADTLCLHGDGEHAVEFASAIRQTLLANRIKIASP